MNNKGFAPVIVIVLIVAVGIGIAGYFVLSQKSNVSTETPSVTQTSPNNSASKPSSTNVPIGAGKTGPLNCPQELVSPGKYYVRLVDKSGASSIKVTAPNGGEEWKLNDDQYQFIKWSETNSNEPNSV